ncbi:MAG: hypothetical protein RL754_108 [Bacteroidota bacterium]|jgi:peptidyl-dipeptidase Dcp
MNPLIQFPQTAHQSLPFSQIQADHFLPALEHWIAVAKERQDAICNNPEVPTFANTVEALEFASKELDVVSSCFFNLNSAETNAEIQVIAREFSPKLTAFGNDTLLNEALFARIKAVWDSSSKETYTGEQWRLLKETYESFVRNGALLEGDDRELLKTYSETLSKAALTFGENVLAETQAFEYHVVDGGELDGLPEDILEMAKAQASEKGKEGYVLGLDMPTYMSVMKYADRSELRQYFYRAFTSRGAKENDHNNEGVIAELVNTRLKKAQLLGFDNHAALTLSKRMAKDAATVHDFLDDLKDVALPAAKSDLKMVEDFALENGAVLPLQAWDFNYWAEKVKRAKYDLDDELLKPYFKLEYVLQGAFDIATKLYGITFNKNADIDNYHEEVDCYEVFDSKGEFLSLLYTDFFPRKGKRAGAWMTSYRSQYTLEGTEVRPHISIVCNFTRPTASKPSLLTFNEVLTLFHEFGHALHGMLAKGHYPSLTGTSVYWDFVELPSQIMENWCYQPEALGMFAKHYETGEVLPAELVEKLRASQTFLEGYMTVRQLSFGYLDMAWHGLQDSFTGSVIEFELAATNDLKLFEHVEGSVTSTTFSHIFQGGYSAGYYSYKWAEVLDADAFERFLDEGIFNQRVASDFYTLLSSGGTVAPDELFRKFRGRDPKVEALLKRAGIA